MDTAFTLLPSQQQLLDRLKYLIEYGDHAILLHGKDGVGKTVLSQVLLECADGLNQSYLHCPPQPDPAAIRTQILNQLFINPLFDPHEPLIDTFERLLQDSEQRLLLVIDDAHDLPQVILAELLTIFLTQSQRSWRLTLVLVSLPQLVQHLLAELPSDYHEHLLPVNIEPLSLAECKQLYGMLAQTGSVSRFVNQIAIDAKLARCEGRASAVAALVSEASPGLPVKAAAFRYRNAIVVLATLMLLGVLWLAIDPLADEEPKVSVPAELDNFAPIERPADMPPLMRPNPAETESTQSIESEVSSEAEETSGESLELAGEWQDISKPQPKPEPKVIPEPVEAPAVASTAQDAEATDASADIAELDPLLLSAQADLAEMEQELAESERQKQAELEQAKLMAESQLPEQPLTIQPLARQPLAQRPEQSFTLQLAVYSYPQLMRRYLTRLDSTDNLALYRKHREPQTWYVVVYGGFNDKVSAQQALPQLPEWVQQSQPYLKSLKEVQGELIEQLDLAAFLAE